MGESIRNVQQFVIGPAGSEVAAILVMMMLVGLITCPLALFADTRVIANGQAPANPCEGQIIANSTSETANQVQVSDASGQSNALDVYTGRSGGTVQRVSAPLSVQNGMLPPNLCIGTVVSDLVRSDGEVIPSDQVTSWALSGNAGRRIFIYIEVSPRYGSVTPAGGYTGTVSMDDERAVGGNVPVDIHVEYPRLWRASMVCIVAAWVGFFWAWLIHLTRADIPNAGRFWLYIILQLAVLTIVSFPVLNAQILTNPDWTGDVSQYIALASLAGGGALATTPTLRALVDRAAIFMPGASPGFVPGVSPAAPSGSSTATTDTTAPAAPQDASASTPQGGDGSSLSTPAGGDGASLTSAPPGGDGGSSSTPAGGDGSSLTSAPPGGNGGSSSTTGGGNGGDSSTTTGGDGGSSSPTTGGSGGSSSTPAGGDGGSSTTPAGGNGGNGGSLAAAPQGGDGGSLIATPQGGDGGTLTAPAATPAAPAAPIDPTASQAPSDPPGN